MPVYGRQHIRNDDKSKLVRLWDKETAPGTLLDQLKNAYLTGFNAVDERDAYRAEETRLDRLKPEALTKAIKDHSINATAKIKRARNVVDKARDRLAELEAATTVPTVDQSEAASRLRDRIWRQIEKIPEGPARDRTIMSMAEKNPIVADCILEMPKELAGVSASTYEEITSKLLEATHGPQLQEMEDLREGISIALSTIEAADEDLRNEVGVHDPRQWAELTEHVKPEAYIPWLRKSGKEVRVLPKEGMESGKGGSAPLASEEDLANGRFFESREAGREPTRLAFNLFDWRYFDMTNRPSAIDAISIADEAINRQTGGAGEQAKAVRNELYSKLSVTDDKVKAQPKRHRAARRPTSVPLAGIAQRSPRSLMRDADGVGRACCPMPNKHVAIILRYKSLNLPMQVQHKDTEG